MGPWECGAAGLGAWRGWRRGWETRSEFKFGEHGSGRTKAPGLRREC